ncbi:MAG TPA: DUF433 domain-containing protein [Candidatus Acidoferrales bacterium]|nr:DUF433 domain-containing protein [Candidatus Acidoferrales bacterium]
METIEYTPAQASAVANLPLPAVHKLIERRLIRPRRLRRGRSIQRMLSREQVLYLRLEAEGVRLLPIAARRAIAKKIESSPEIDTVALTEGSALVIEVKSVRLELDSDLRKLERAENMIVSDPEIMRGTPVYRGTRIPVELIADMLSQGANPEEVIEGYPALDREKVELAPLYVQAFPRRGRPASRPWAKRKPLRVTRHPRTLAE